MNEKKVEYAREMRTSSPIFTLFRAFISVNIIIRICALQSAHTTHTHEHKQTANSFGCTGGWNEWNFRSLLFYISLDLAFSLCKLQRRRRKETRIGFALYMVKNAVTSQILFVFMNWVEHKSIRRMKNNSEKENKMRNRMNFDREFAHQNKRDCATRVLQSEKVILQAEIIRNCIKKYKRDFFPSLDFHSFSTHKSCNTHFYGIQMRVKEHLLKYSYAEEAKKKKQVNVKCCNRRMLCTCDECCLHGCIDQIVPGAFKM